MRRKRGAGFAKREGYQIPGGVAMTVKSKLLGNIALTIVGISVIAGIGLFSIAKVKSSIEILTGKSTPLHLKMLELQQTVEKVSADFMRLEIAIKEVKGVATEILNQIGAEEGGLVALRLEILNAPPRPRWGGSPARLRRRGSGSRPTSAWRGSCCSTPDRRIWRRTSPRPPGP